MESGFAGALGNCFFLGTGGFDVFVTPTEYLLLCDSCERSQICCQLLSHLEQDTWEPPQWS